MFRKIVFCMIAVIALFAQQAANAQIASEDFDGGDVNLISGFNPADEIYNIPNNSSTFGVFTLSGLRTMGGAPFALVDDSVADVSGSGVFPDDFEGIYGAARDPDDGFFCIVSVGDTFFPDINDRTTSWTFDVSTAAGEPLNLSIDMGSMSNDGGDGQDVGNFVNIEYRFDGGTFQEAMSLAPVELVGHPSGFMWRDMDDGDNAGIDFNENFTHLGLEVTTSGVTKTLAEDGSADNNTILNKTPVSGPGGGLLDTYSVGLIGSGLTLELRLTCDMEFEAFSIDNILLTTGGDVLKGDVNLDGSVDLLDVGPFVNVLNGGDFQAEADCDCNGTVNLLDVGPFIDILGG